MTRILTVGTVDEALQAIRDYQGAPQTFVLRVPLSLLGETTLDGQRVTGLQTALITDAAFKRGWFPAGVENDGTFWTCKYTDF
jgi:hypothetical protein